ncbi:MAG: flagellar assembly protein [Pseudobdellovibrio sp.]|jgi:flagellar assembly protein FliH|nr:flagellar assembly protein [Pseudobdellovibrio sp.]
MRWSSILKQDHEEVEKDVTILSYTPKQFNFGTPEAALDYLKEKELGSDFIMSDVLRNTTGVEEIERLSEEQKIEQKVLDKISLLQEDAYKMAYDLGFEEGTKKAIEDKTAELEQKLAELGQLTATLTKIKEEMVYQNEAHMLRMIYEIASRLAFDHVTEKQEVVLIMIKKAIEEAQAEENVNVRVSSAQLEFLEQVKQSSGREYEFLKKVKFEGVDNVSVGSCVVETNYGVIDARIEERIDKLWNELKQAMPKVKSPIEPT